MHLDLYLAGVSPPNTYTQFVAKLNGRPLTPQPQRVLPPRGEGQPHIFHYEDNEPRSSHLLDLRLINPMAGRSIHIHGITVNRVPLLTRRVALNWGSIHFEFSIKQGKLMLNAYGREM